MPTSHLYILSTFQLLLFAEGTSIMINTLRLHRREDLGWSRPFDFVPERWETEEPHYLKSAFCYMPFGGGARMCVGSSFAMTEAKIIVVMVLQQFNVTLVPVCGCTCCPVGDTHGTNV